MLAWSGLLAILFACLFNWLLFYGTIFAGAGTAAAMQPGVPVYTALIATMLGIETATAAQAIGTVFTVGGALTMTRAWDVKVRIWREIGLYPRQSSLIRTHTQIMNE